MLIPLLFRAHSCTTGKNIDNQSVGRSCGGFSTKIHAACDSLGYPLHFEITAGQLHDITTISTKIKHAPVKNVFIADKAFDCDYVIDSFKIENVEVMIPSKKNRGNPRHHNK